MVYACLACSPSCSACLCCLLLLSEQDMKAFAWYAFTIV